MRLTKQGLSRLPAFLKKKSYSSEKIGMGIPKKRAATLSKSRLMRGLQCAKSLFLTIHHPELEPKITDSQQALFDQGHEVGIRAQQEIPGGVLIEAPYYDPEGAIKETEAAMKNGAHTIYEATLAKNGISAKIDILNKGAGNRSWQLIEVKSSTSVKPEHLVDVAIQVHVAEQAGLQIEKAEVMHLNNQSTAPKLENLFTRNEVTTSIDQNRKELPSKISALQGILSKSKPPKTDIGAHCFEPYECPFVKHCWSHISSPSIFDVPGLGAKVWEFYEQGIVSVSDPRFGPFTGAKAARLNAIRTGSRWIDVPGISKQLSDWRWPLIHLDFETINFAIPKYDGTRPYEQIPFQFSCMIQEKRLALARHVEFLHDELTDPRPSLIAALTSILKNSGSIVAYNKGFESARMRAMATAYPSYSDILLEACERLVDPLPIFRNHVYDPAFKDSFSIKNVAPAILGEQASYKGMSVSDGVAAQRAFVELIDVKTPSERKVELKREMLAYCKKDTEVMVQLVDWLVSLAKEKAAA